MPRAFVCDIVLFVKTFRATKVMAFSWDHLSFPKKVLVFQPSVDIQEAESGCEFEATIIYVISLGQPGLFSETLSLKNGGGF